MFLFDQINESDSKSESDKYVNTFWYVCPFQ